MDLVNGDAHHARTQGSKERPRSRQLCLGLR
jgi:hypothetical protein